MIRSKRKDDHVAFALSQASIENDFKNVKLIHQSLPSMNLKDVDLSANYCGHDFKYPIYINAMTGGSNKTLEINKNLAKIAAHFGLAMAVGSQHVALDDSQFEQSFKIVRETNPDGFLIGNVGANASVDDAKRAIKMIDANALGIHINVAQELTMDEGDREFSHWKSNIKAIVEAVDVPVIVKEVGFGMSVETVQALYELGVKHVDVSGHGGTNFIWIENARSEKKRYDYLLDWGITPIESLLMVKSFGDRLELLASGGVKTPLDAIKLLMLGAKGVGVSGYFLKVAHLDNLEIMFEEVSLFLEDMKKIMVMSNSRTMDDLSKASYQLKGDLSSYEK